MAGSEETMTCLTSVQAQLTSSDWRCWREISEPSGAHARHTVEDRVNKQSAAMTPCCQLKGLVLATRLVPGQGADTALRPDVSQVFDDNTSLMAEAFSHGQWVNAGSLSASYDALQRLRERLISGLKCGVAALERPAFAKSVLTRPDVIDCKAPLFGDHTSAPPPLTARLRWLTRALLSSSPVPPAPACSLTQANLESIVPSDQIACFGALFRIQCKDAVGQMTLRLSLQFDASSSSCRNSSSVADPPLDVLPSLRIALAHFLLSPQGCRRYLSWA